MFVQFLIVVLFTHVSIFADCSYWDAQLVRSYAHTAELQRRWAMAFLAPHLKTLKGDEKVLDVGCGDGKITADISKYVPEGSVTGIDLSLAMLEWAQKQYHPLEYPNLTFLEGEFLAPPVAGPFDLIVSFCALQHCSDPQSALKKLYALLRPGGKLLILVPAMANTAWSQARTTVQNRPTWAPYWKGFAPRKFLSPQQSIEMLQLAQFTAIKVTLTKTQDPFINREEIIDWLMGTFAPVVPRSMARTFYREWIEEYLRLDPEARRPDGVIYAKLGTVEIEATRGMDVKKTN
jgi:trans-aconitate 2-methyltransferase